MQPCAHITNKILEAQGFGTYCYVFYFRNNKVLLNVQLNVWAECMNRQCSCNTVTVACAVPTNSLCKVNEWYQHDCVTRSGILYRTGDTATVSYTGMTITEGRTQTKQTRSQLLGQIVSKTPDPGNIISSSDTIQAAQLTAASPSLQHPPIGEGTKRVKKYIEIVKNLTGKCQILQD